MGIGYLSELGVEAMSIGYVYCSIAEPLVRVLKLRSEPPTMLDAVSVSQLASLQAPSKD
jgi:hypothetical protein